MPRVVEGQKPASAESESKEASKVSSGPWRPRAASGKKDDAVPEASASSTKEKSDPPWRRGSEARHRVSKKKEELPRTESAPAAVPSAPRASPLGMIKQNTSRTQWRSLINKLTPEKFEKLSEQFLATLPGGSEAGAASEPASPVSSEELRGVLEELLSLIFQASSKQHQYTEMYTELCSKVIAHVSKHCPALDGRSVIWEKCQGIFLTTVLTAPEFPPDLPEDELGDRRAKHKHTMVGMVKFGGDLVSHGLVPPAGVIEWIHTLLSEKQKDMCGEELDEDSDAEPECALEKDNEKREVQLEVLCAILASMGSSLSDRNTWSEENRNVIEDVFMQLELLSMEQGRLSLRIRCLIRDILDLRMAQWKDKEYKLKPQMLERRVAEDDLSTLRSDAPEFVPGSKIFGGSQWMDPQLLSCLEAIEHHLEVIDEKESKLERLRKLIQLYAVIQDRRIVITANTSNIKKILELFTSSFKDLDFKHLDCTVPEDRRGQYIESFESGKTTVLVMSSEVSTRRDFLCSRPGSVLVNFDFPMTLQLYLYRIFKRTDNSMLVYTFFSPQSDLRHTVSLMLALEAAQQKVPPSLVKLKEGIKSEAPPSREKGGGSGSGGGRSKKDSESRPSKTDDDPAERQHRDKGGGSASKSRRGETSEEKTSKEEQSRRSARRDDTAEPDTKTSSTSSWRRDEAVESSRSEENRENAAKEDAAWRRREATIQEESGDSQSRPRGSTSGKRSLATSRLNGASHEPAEERAPDAPQRSTSGSSQGSTPIRGQGSSVRKELLPQRVPLGNKPGTVTIKQRPAPSVDSSAR